MNEIIQKLEEHDKLLRKIDDQLDLLAHKAVEHDGEFERIDTNIAGLATKAEINKIMVTLDTLVGMYKTNEQERTFLAHGLRKTDGRVEILEHDVAKMKPALGLN